PFSPAWVNDQILVIATGNQCAVLDATTGKPLRFLAGAPGQPTALAVSPDQRHVAVMAPEIISLSDVRTGEQAGLVQQQGLITCLPFSPDGRFLLSSGHGIGSVRLWKVPDLTPVEQIIRQPQSVCVIATTTD